MKLKILHLEDTPSDAELVERELKRSELEFEKIVVSDRTAFIKALFEFAPDIVISDHTLPTFNSLEALEIIRNRDVKTPVILVTSTISEEFAAEIIRQGAYDYILKDRLQRLPGAILNAIEKCKLENERDKYIKEIISYDNILKRAEKLAHFGLWESDLVSGVVKWSDEMYELFGYKKNEIEPSLQSILQTLVPEDVEPTRTKIQDAVMNLNSLNLEYRTKDKEGKIKYISSLIVVERDAAGKAIRTTGFNQDITKEKEASIENEKLLTDVLKRNEELEQFSYIVSHNLRAPVANIIGLIGVLQTEEFKNEEIQNMVAGLDTSATKLDSVILDLNHILKVRGSIYDEKETVSFTELVGDVKQLIASLIEDKQAEIITDFSEIDKLETVKSFMMSIFYNLILNGINFGRPDLKPVIKIKSHKVKNKITLVFEDNGIGMDLSVLENKIFKPFNRYHDGQKGNGIGLFIVKTQVEALKGKLSVNSAVNKGSEFRIEFETTAN